MLFLSGFLNTAHAISLNVKLPAIGGADPGTSPAAFINYVVVFSFAFVGAAALIMLVAGGVRYLTAAGNPSAVSDAEERIKSALLGLLIVFAAITVLHTINPDFVRLRNPALPIIQLPTSVVSQDVPPGSCKLTAAAWSAAQSCYNDVAKSFDEILMSVRGENCDGWGVSFTVVDTTTNAAVDTDTDVFDSSNIAQASWPPQKIGRYTFTAIAGSGNQQTQITSGSLLVTDGICISTPTTDTCGDPNLVCSQTTCPGISAEGQSWLPILQQVAQQYPISSDVNTAKFLETIMKIESFGGRMDALSSQGSCGLMQFQPATANLYAALCGIDHPITCGWLRGFTLEPGETRDTVARASFCMAAQFAASMRNGSCFGGQIRDLAAGYNGGGGCDSSVRTDNALAQSLSCPEADCSLRPTLRYECLWENLAHTTCNERPGHGGFGETRRYVAKFNACYDTIAPPRSLVPN